MIAVLVFWIVIYMPLFKASWRCGDFGDFVVVTIQFSSARKGLNFYPINFSCHMEKLIFYLLSGAH